ncbi:phospholipase-like protein [Tanacetum coccineum]
MDLSDIKVPRVFVTCRSNENENIPLYYHIVDNFHIQFGRKEFCLVSGLKFGVENSTDYNKAKDPIPFRRMVFSSYLDGGPIRGNDVELLIESDVFKKLDDNDAVSLCCVGILQLVLLGVEDRRLVPNWILRLANDRVSWDNYHWGSYVWPTLYKYLRDANVKRWQPLYVSDPTNETDTKSYSIEGFALGGSRGVPSSFHTLANNISFFNIGTPFKCQTPNQSNWLSPSNWQTPNPSYLGTPNSQPPILSQPGTSNWQNPMTSYSPNFPPLIPSRGQDARILDPNLCDRARREPQPSVYMLSPYTVLPPTTVLTKKRIDKTKKKGNTKKLSPLNLGNTFADENVSGDDVTITGVQQTDNYFNYENVDPDKVTRDAYVTMTEFILDPYDIYLDCYMKGYKVPSFFWPQLVPHLCTYRREQSWPEGWLSSDHMNSWIQILIRERTENANWTLAKSGTVCLHQENNCFMILTDPHNIGTLDGSVRPFPSWNDVTWVYMPINAGEVY